MLILEVTSLICRVILTLRHTGCWQSSCGAVRGVAEAQDWLRASRKAGRCGRAVLLRRNATGCAGVRETRRVGTHSRAQGCMLGISSELGRSREGGEHDLENPYRDEKVQSASTFLCWLGWQRALRLHWAQQTAPCRGCRRSLLWPAAGRPSVPRHGCCDLRVWINRRDQLLKLTVSMHFIYLY